MNKNLADNNMARAVPLSVDNYSVTVDPEKQQMKINLRGHAPIEMKATALPKERSTVLEKLGGRSRGGSTEGERMVRIGSDADVLSDFGST